MLRWTKRRIGQDRERGATMLLVTISMIMLLLFGAFAVDLGGAWSQRRENQGAVDPAGIGGALETRSKTQAQAIADADAEIMRLTYSSIDPDMTLAQWQGEWAACTDPAKGAQFTITGSSDCISYTNNLQRVRAKTPLVDTNTTFAAIIGLDTLQTDAFVEVIIGLDGGGGAILPFGLPGAAAGDTEICLKTGPNPNGVPPCDGPVTGNFGFLDISEYGNELFTPPTVTVCNGATNTRLARNIARGVDHPIVEAPNAGAPFRRDRDGCNSGNFNYEPYSLTTETGNKVGVLDNGFIEGVSGLPGRLTLSSDLYVQGGKAFDDKPLWEYLNAAGQGFCGAVSDHDAMAVCLSNMAGSASTQSYFLDSLADSPRFAWVPLFYGVTLGLGNTTLNIDEFRPVYIQTTFWQCNANDCDAIHDPSELPVLGSKGAISGNDKLEAVTALQIPRKNLPDVIDEEFFGEGGQTFYAIIE